MEGTNFLPLALGLIIFSFLINSVLVVPFIDLLYKLNLTRRKEAPKKGKIPLFDKLHDIKAGTPVGGGILVIASVVTLFAILFPITSKFGVYIQSSYKLSTEVFVILFTFISFGLLGLADDLVKIFGKGRSGLGKLGLSYGLSRRHKFILQWILALATGFFIYRYLGIQFIHIPLLDKTINLGLWYIPFSALIIVTFTNAYNITDGLDGLAGGVLMLCLIAFLYFNVYPARIFMGDAGALSFGATLAVIGLLTGSLVALFVIGGIFFLEIASSAIQIIGWKFLKRPILPLAPLHHSLLAIGWEEPKIVMRAWLAGIILAIFGLWLATI